MIPIIKAGCMTCGHNWVVRKESPLRCPRCNKRRPTEGWLNIKGVLGDNNSKGLLPKREDL